MSKDKLFTARRLRTATRRRIKGDVSLPQFRNPSIEEKLLAAYLFALALSCGLVRYIDKRDEFFDSPKRPRLIDTLAFSDHNCVYVTPAEVGQARRVNARQRVEAN